MRLVLPVLCLLCAVSSCGAQVSQSPEVLVSREGDRAAMACTYSSAFQTFQWYRQAPSGEITHLLSVPANRNVTAGLFTGESLENGKKSTLHLVELRLADSGRYLCATDAQQHGQSPAPRKNPPSPDNPGGRDTGIPWQGQRSQVFPECKVSPFLWHALDPIGLRSMELGQWKESRKWAGVEGLDSQCK